jgi:hypothetical protein
MGQPPFHSDRPRIQYWMITKHQPDYLMSLFKRRIASKTTFWGESRPEPISPFPLDPRCSSSELFRFDIEDVDLWGKRSWQKHDEKNVSNQSGGKGTQRHGMKSRPILTYLKSEIVNGDEQRIITIGSTRRVLSNSPSFENISNIFFYDLKHPSLPAISVWIHLQIMTSLFNCY